MHTIIGIALKPILWAPCCRVLYFLKHAFSSITQNLLNLLNKSPKIFALISLKCCFHTYIPWFLSKTTSPQKLFDYDCVTLYTIVYHLGLDNFLLPVEILPGLSLIVFTPVMGGFCLGRHKKQPPPLLNLTSI